MCKIFFFGINILTRNKNPYMRPLLLEITVWEVKGERNGKTVHVLWQLTVKQTHFQVWSYGSVSRKTHFSSSFPSPLIVHGLPVSCPFNFPNGNLKQQWSHIGVFICYQNIDAKRIINLHIYGIHLLNTYKTVGSHLKLPAVNREFTQTRRRRQRERHLKM